MRRAILLYMWCDLEKLFLPVMEWESARGLSPGGSES